MIYQFSVKTILIITRYKETENKIISLTNFFDILEFIINKISWLLFEKKNPKY